MQKLFRRSPLFPLPFSTKTTPPLTTNSYTKDLSLFLGFIRGFQNSNFFSISLYLPPPTLSMPAFSDIRSVLNISGYSQHLRTKLSDVPSQLYSTNCRVCYCALANGKPPWTSVMLRKGRTRFLSASYHTSCDDEIKSPDTLGAIDDDEHIEKGGEVLSSGEISAEEQASEKLVSLDSSSEEKRIRSNRRQKSYSDSASAVAAALPENPDLLTIPGVGPRNLKKLVKKGFEEVSQLKHLYREKFFWKSNQKMVEYLRSFVGIIHRNHAESITTYIKKCVDAELEDSSNSGVKAAQNNRLTFCVEGNISVGKTTFLQRIANETLELRDLVEIVPEPINKWQDIGPDHFNILDAFYAEPQRYAYTFQNYVFVTRVMQERESSCSVKPLRLMERSVFSDRMVFVRAVHEANWMNEMEISIYDSWFDPVVSTLPGLIPDGFIYLRATPDTCHKRMMLRKRTEEGGVSLDYLQGLHEKHESWLFPSQTGTHGIFSVTKLPIHLDTSLHPDIRDRVFYLEGEHMHSSIQKVPALVLDCEPNIDFSKDVDAKQQYARQVAEFFAFVKKRNEAVTPKVGNASAKNKQPRVFVPHKGLWVPSDGTRTLKDFRRRMSLMSS